MFSEQLLERLPQWLSQITPDFTSLDPSAITDFFMIQIEGVQSYDELRLKAITSLVDFLDERTEEYVDFVLDWMKSETELINNETKQSNLKASCKLGVASVINKVLQDPLASRQRAERNYASRYLESEQSSKNDQPSPLQDSISHDSRNDSSQPRKIVVVKRNSQRANATNLDSASGSAPSQSSEDQLLSPPPFFSDESSLSASAPSFIPSQGFTNTKDGGYDEDRGSYHHKNKYQRSSSGTRKHSEMDHNNENQNFAPQMQMQHPMNTMGGFMPSQFGPDMGQLPVNMMNDQESSNALYLSNIPSDDMERLQNHFSEQYPAQFKRFTAIKRKPHSSNEEAPNMTCVAIFKNSDSVSAILRDGLDLSTVGFPTVKVVRSRPFVSQQQQQQQMMQMQMQMAMQMQMQMQMYQQNGGQFNHKQQQQNPFNNMNPYAGKRQQKGKRGQSPLDTASADVKSVGVVSSSNDTEPSEIYSDISTTNQPQTQAQAPSHDSKSSVTAESLQSQISTLKTELKEKAGTLSVPDRQALLMKIGTLTKELRTLQ